MGTLSFGQLPMIAKVAVGIAFYDAWWSVEEFVIDRYGLWRYMPYYRVSDPCVWDLAVALLIAIAQASQEHARLDGGSTNKGSFRG